MHAEHDAVAPRQAAVHPFDLIGVDVGAGAFHGGWQIDDHLALRAGVPDGADRVADLQRIVQLGQAECFGRILVDPFRAGIGVGQGADLTRAGQRQVLDLIPAHAEDDAAPLRRDRVIQVDDSAASAAQRFKGAFDQVGPRLGQHLDGDVVGNAFFLDELAHEVEVRVRGRWESNFDFLQAHGDQLFEEAQFARGVHRFDQGLVAVAHVGAHPDGRRIQAARRPGPFGIVAGEGVDGRYLCWGCSSIMGCPRRSLVPARPCARGNAPWRLPVGNANGKANVAAGAARGPGLPGGHGRRPGNRGVVVARGRAPPARRRRAQAARVGRRGGWRA